VCRWPPRANDGAAALDRGWADSSPGRHRLQGRKLCVCPAAAMEHGARFALSEEPAATGGPAGGICSHSLSSAAAPSLARGGHHHLRFDRRHVASGPTAQGNAEKPQAFRSARDQEWEQTPPAGPPAGRGAGHDGV